MPGSTDPLTLLAQAVDAAEAVLPPAEVWQWIGLALRDHIFTGQPLEDCLGLRNGSTSRTLRTRYLTLQRDRHLKAALDLCGGSAKELARRVRHFETGRWNNWQYRQEPPPNATDFQRLLFRIFQLGVGVPKTAAGIRKGINRAHPSPFSQHGFSLCHEEPGNEDRDAA